MTDSPPYITRVTLRRVKNLGNYETVTVEAEGIVTPTDDPDIILGALDIWIGDWLAHYPTNQPPPTPATIAQHREIGQLASAAFPTLTPEARVEAINNLFKKEGGQTGATGSYATAQAVIAHLNKLIAARQ